MRYLEKQQLDHMQDNNQIMLTMQHNTDDLAIKSTIIDISGQTPFAKTEINVGKPQKIQILANFTNYDAIKTALLKDSIFGIETKHLVVINMGCIIDNIQEIEE
jgi:hypothetical protein